MCADEFRNNANLPREIYVREGRRMISDLVMTERHLCGLPPSPALVAQGSYNISSHNVRRYVDARSFARNEGHIPLNPSRSY